MGQILQVTRWGNEFVSPKIDAIFGVWAVWEPQFREWGLGKGWREWRWQWKKYPKNIKQFYERKVKWRQFAKTTKTKNLDDEQMQSDFSGWSHQRFWVAEPSEKYQSDRGHSKLGKCQLWVRRQSELIQKSGWPHFWPFLEAEFSAILTDFTQERTKDVKKQKNIHNDIRRLKRRKRVFFSWGFYLFERPAVALAGLVCLFTR